MKSVLFMVRKEYFDAIERGEKTYDYTLPNPLPTAQDQARTELQSEGRIPK